MSTHSYDLIEESHGYRLYRRDDGRYTVVRRDAAHHSVLDAMPGDRPADGGSWTSSATDAGIDYVSSGYSQSYARRIYRALVTDAREYDLALA